MRETKAIRWTPELRHLLDRSASQAGFGAVGLTGVDGPEEPASAQQAVRLETWIDAGHAGDMNYLKRRDEAGTLLRSNLRVAIPWARSVIVCALNFNAEAPRSIEPASTEAGWIARYAWTGRILPDGSSEPTDYHEELLTRLRGIETELLARTDCTTRCYVDTGPILERNLAAEAGIGWIGKNTCVINQQLGSWVLLGVIVTSLPVADEVATLPMPDRCGTCTRCIDACPTGALLGSSQPDAPRTMDATRCIAYLTIEKKGSIEESLRTPMGRQVFGCDICQDVCPWNRKAPRTSFDVNDAGLHARAELINPALDWLAAMDAREFKRRFKGSPLERTGRKRVLRNVAIAMGNSGDSRYLQQLEEWSSGTSGDEESPSESTLRESAQWAREQILACQTVR